MTSLTGRRMLITGASSGIGEAVARDAAKAGAMVGCIARREDRLQALSSEVGGFHAATDITDYSGVARAVDHLAESMGGIDIVVNNAGTYLLGGIEDGTFEDWKRMFDVNVLGLLATTKACYPYLKKSEAADIVNVSSVGGRRVARPSTAIYSATKFAIHAISEGWRQELSAEGVRITVISPGLVQTEIGSENRNPHFRDEVAAKKEKYGVSVDAVSRQVIRVLTEPREVNLYEVVVMPTSQPV